MSGLLKGRLLSPYRRYYVCLQTPMLNRKNERYRIHRRHIGFFVSIARAVATRLALAAGVLGASSIYLDKKITEWNDDTWGPIKRQFDYFKTITKPYRDIPQELKDIIKVDPDLFKFDIGLWESLKLSQEGIFGEDIHEGSVDTKLSNVEEIKVEPVEKEFKAVAAKSVPDENNEQKTDEIFIVNEILTLDEEVSETLLAGNLSLETSMLKEEHEIERTILVTEIEDLKLKILDMKNDVELLEQGNIDLACKLHNISESDGEKTKQLSQLQNEIFENELRHQKQIIKFELESDELHERLEKVKNQKSVSSVEKNRVSLVELYSTVLDELDKAKRALTYLQCPELPRVVVVGDQSSGKTSVLESVARARIFPRGGGKMMTRSPVKVTITEGPRHTASFPDDDRTYRLNNQEDLADLRNAIETRMCEACRGKTISCQVVSLNIKGPGLKRMVLVDLPGLISTETTGIMHGTKNEIIKLAWDEMSHPSSIILCVQDGSVDAERSQVTDYVRNADPTGERTLLVLTKVDKAICDPVRLKQILDGKLFPLRALGYFAVVTGMDNKDASMSEIQAYETEVLKTSELFRSGLLKSGQLGTLNMCDTVSKTFWNLVKNSLGEELHKLNEHLFALETEWRNNFRNVRELDRYQIFEKGKEDILDRLVHLNTIDEGQFEEELKEELWQLIDHHFLTEIYLPSEQNSNTASEFNTLADIRLRNFTNNMLPKLSLDAAGDLLLHHFDQIVSSQKSPIYKDLFEHVGNGSKQRFKDELGRIRSQILNELRVLQQSTVSNRFIQSQSEWEAMSDHLIRSLRLQLNGCWDTVERTCGPIWYKQYYYWTKRTKEQFTNDRIKRVLDNYPTTTSSRLTKEQVTRARYEVDKQWSLKVNEAQVDDVWKAIYSRRWIEDLENRARDCKYCFQKHRSGKINSQRSRLLCEDVVLWWRMNKAVEITAANLRQRMLSEDGAQFLKNGIGVSLDLIEENEESIKQLIKGRQVDLAEEMKFIKNIISLLQQLNIMLKTES